MNYIKEDGKKYVMLKLEVKEMNDASVGDYVEHDGEIYKFQGYDYEYIMLEDEDGNEKHIQGW